MRIINKEIDKQILNVKISLSRERFDQARKTAYHDNTDKFVVPGCAGGQANLKELEKIYGPAVLYDEALSIAIPEIFNSFLDKEGIRIMGKPQLSDLAFSDGGVLFNVKAYIYPEIRLGQYKSLKVPFRRGGEQEMFEAAVIQKACENMKGELPPHMIEQKMESIVAREKLNVTNEAIYHLLADALVILREAYVAAGAVRPKVQIRREAMDLMLQTVSAENYSNWEKFFRTEIKTMVERYHCLPDNFDELLERIINNRMKEKNSMDRDKLADDIFAAYLGSLELSEEQWKNQRRIQAAREACVDLLLDGVAVKEGLQLDPEELKAAVEGIAGQCNMSAEEVEGTMDLEPLKWKLMRDKAMALILNSAETDEELRRKLAEEKACIGENNDRQ